MGGFSQYFDIILFAMIAGFLILRLRSVLGRRTGDERQRPNFLQRGPGAGKIINLPGRDPAMPAAPAVAETDASDPVAAGIAQLRQADPSFDPAQFLDGARTAFDMIVAAFAVGDRKRLQPLLSSEVYRSFAGAVEAREAAQETLESRVVRMRSADISEAGLDGRTARVTVKFVSDQLNVTRAHDGSIVDGDPARPIEKTDYWTFSRDTRSADPNWVLTATGSA